MIRRATSADATAIAEVHVASWRWAYRGLMPDALLDGLSVEQRAASWRRWLVEHDALRVWLAQRDGRAIGFASTNAARTVDQPPLAAELTALYLAEDAAGTGAGRALLEHALADLRDRGFRRATLWVLGSNARARRFYQRAGWRADGVTRVEQRGGASLEDVRYAIELGATVIVVPELRTERLLLRRWRDADREPFAAINADPRAMEFFPRTQSRGDSDATVDRIVRHFDERGFGLWAVEVAGGAPFIGFVGLLYPHRRPPAEPRVEIGWRLAPAHWGAGYATEGARAALAAGFGPLFLDEIVSMTTVSNTRSRAVMEKLGMRRSPDDDFDSTSFPDGHPMQRHVLYRLRRR